MLLTFEDIKNITFGYEEILKNKSGVFFKRFTSDESGIYSENKELYPRTNNPAGIKMHFKTDAQSVNMDVFTDNGTDRLFFAIDIYSNGVYTGSIKNYDNDIMTGAYSESGGKPVIYPSGDFSGCFELGMGEKEITIYMPWSLPVYIKNLELVGASYVKSIPYDKTMLIYGDSITHGYDSINPSKAYSVKLAEVLNAECYIKAIGGDVFRPELAKAADIQRKYDYITIAYGTNDYGAHPSGEVFEQKAEEFIASVRQMHPESKIFVLTPIWRKNCPESTKVGTMEYIHGKLHDIANSLPDTYSIYGWNLVPHDGSLYGDLWLHPSNEGFEYYFKNLYEEIKKYL